MGPSGFLAILAGWIVTEVGRQPYTIYNFLRTEDSVSAITAEQVTLSLIAFMVVYSIIFSAGIWYIFKLVRKGPQVGKWHDTYGAHGMIELPTINNIFPSSHKKGK